jgi:hypothetical protein
MINQFNYIRLFLTNRHFPAERVTGDPTKACLYFNVYYSHLPSALQIWIEYTAAKRSCPDSITILKYRDVTLFS